MKANKLVLKNITLSNKENSYALNNFSFDLKKSEVHALYGEHSCGKSSVLKVISGEYCNYKGNIILDGKEVKFNKPKDSIKRNISVIHQYSTLIPDFNSYENVYSGRFITNTCSILNKKKMLKKIIMLMDEFNVNFNVNAPVSTLSTFDRNFLEIAKAVIHAPDILILDEVSSRFRTEELKILHILINRLKKSGKSIIYIFSNINEDFDFADRITIIKDGRRQGTEHIKNIDKSKLIEISYAKLLTIDNNKTFLWDKEYKNSVINELKEGIIVLKDIDSVSDINKSAKDILNLGKNGYNLSQRIHEDYILDKNSCKLLKSAITDGFHVNLSSVELVNGKILNIIISPISNSSNNSIIILEDVTEKSHMLEYKVGAEKVFSVAELAAGVVHEINNPLAIISNYIEILKMKNTDKTCHEKFQKIQKELLRIEEIAGSLLSFSKVQSGKKIVDLRNLVSETLVLIEYKIKKKNIKITFNIDESQTFLVDGNPNKLKQVVINLVTNSIESVLDEGIISIDIIKLNGAIVFSISDNGSGINQEVEPKIFDPFFSTKVTKKNTGLGLSISKHIIEDHKGEIKFKTVNDLTTFFFKLPEASGD